MALKLTIDFGKGAPRTAKEASVLAQDAARRGDEGWHCHWDGIRFLLDATWVKKARPQAERLVLAWCRACTGLRYPDGPRDRADLVDKLIMLLREGMPAWLDDIDGERRRQLEKARTRKRTLHVSQKAVKELEEFRSVFVVTGREIAEGLDLRALGESWCLQAIDECLGYWREQLAFIEARIAEGESGGRAAQG
ncbi:MAG TPA: hypothetical protein VM243_08465 [Phycisphaerae bacterium]|nr:hypothetical protein [Phycisphaerae bacterium]